MAEHTVAGTVQEPESVNAAEGYSFSALLEKFFQESPLGKELSEAQLIALDKKGQELFMGSEAFVSSQPASH